MNLSFKQLNNLLGWFCFMIAAATYLATIEPTVSFWDCGEYITAASKLEVTHSPGAAFFQIFGAFASLFAFGEATNYAIVINSVSALSSAFSILFLFWTISHLAKRMFFSSNQGKLKTSEQWIVLGSAMVGALSFTFTDSFWFSATEGEVYAMASFFTALLMWLILKWEDAMDQKDPRADKWLILITLLTGIATGVHLMTILIIPFIGFIYYFKNNKKYDLKNFILANIAIIAVLGIVFKGLFSFTMSFFGKSEIFFVNNFGLPFHSGTFISFLLYIFVFYLVLRITKKNKLYLINKIALGLLFLLIGFSSWLVIPIRAIAKPPMNLNDPSDALGMLDYYNREQYGSWPILYGPNYAAHTNDDGVKRDEYGSPLQIDKGAVYVKDEKLGKYVVVERRKEYVYQDKYNSIFPRMFSSDPGHIRNYKMLTGSLAPGESPSLFQNVNYFLNYQVGYMYLRYFMWNFSGRQNDIQGNLEPTKGNWISGISFIDNLRGIDMENIPDSLVNKGTNTYYMIPLLFGLIGLFFHANKDFERFWALLVAFLLTGIGIIIYTSVKPFEPRERDYALVSSFYIFAIWIGLGILAIFKQIYKFNPKIAAIVCTLLGMSSPILLASNNWDDHDRSNRKVAWALAKGYLDSCEKDGILIVYGDNDTYPLWYMQEVEQYRTDVKVINFTLLATQWHIDQARKQSYDAKPIASTLIEKDYRKGHRDLNYLIPHIDSVNVKDLMGLVSNQKKWSKIDKSIQNFYSNMANSDNPREQQFAESILGIVMGEEEAISYLPSDTFYLEVDKEKVLKNKIVSPKDSSKIVNRIKWKYGDQSLYKNELLLLDFIATNNWERPVYFSGGGLYNEENVLFLKDYLQYQGLVYQLVPVRSSKESDGGSDVDRLLANFNKFEFGGLGDPSIYLDETNRRQVFNYRGIAARLASELIAKGREKEAEEVLDRMIKNSPQTVFENSYSMMSIIQNYYQLKKDKKADKLANYFFDDLLSQIDFYSKKVLDHPILIYDLEAAIQKFNLLIEASKDGNKDLIIAKLKKLQSLEQADLLKETEGYNYGIIKTLHDVGASNEALNQANEYLNYLEIKLKASINAGDEKMLENTAKEFMATTGLVEDFDSIKANEYKAKFEQIIRPIIEAQQQR